MKRALSRKNLWDKTPGPVKTFAAAVLSKVPLPWLLGGDYRRWYQFACGADRWDAQRAREYQLAKLRRIVNLAYGKSEFYRRSFHSVGFEPGDLKEPEDLQRLPTIDKNTIREHWQQMLIRPMTDRDVDLVTTGGTSGEPLRFYISSARHAPEYAHLTMCWKRTGYRLGDVMAVLRGRVIGKPAGCLQYEYDPLLRHHYYSTFHMAPDDLRGYLDHIVATKPAYIHAYPTALWTLAKFAIAENVPLPASLRGALVESEPLYAHQRALLDDKLGLNVFSAYGLSEKVILAAECEGSHAYHAVPTYGYCEIVNAAGRVVAAGQEGELTGTGFINEVMPFIRYRTGDDAQFLGEKCEACGREQLLFDKIQPRRGQEFLLCRDGRTLVSMATLTGGLLHDDTLDGIIRFQFLQERAGQVILQLVPGIGSAKYTPDKIHRHFAEQLGHGIDLEVRFVHEIPLSRVGKQPMILQRCPEVEALLHVDDEK